jgi:signal transduction histidine kinase
MYCLNIIQTNLLIFSGEVPQLLYYSHLPAFILSILLGLWVYFSSQKNLESKIFLILSLVFSLLSFLNLIIWTNSNSLTISISWILTIELFNWLLFLIAYFFYVFISHNDVRFIVKISILFFLLLSPIYIFSRFGISEFDLNSCELVINNGYYLYQLFINLLAIAIIIFTFLKYQKKIISSEKTKNTLFFIAVLVFSGFFLTTWHLSSYFDIFIYEQIGYIGFVVFIILISYLIVKFNAFHIKLLATQALIWGLIALIGSQFFFIKVTTNFILNGITFVGIIISGRFLIKSVKKEVSQREQLEDLTDKLEKSKLRLEESNLNLEKANDKLQELDKLKTEFVSLASHQLRSPLTAIKGYTSMLLEGDYGEINPQAKETIGRVMESSNNLTMVVEDLLNVSKIEQGGMKYVMNTFDLGDLVRNVSKELSISAEKKGLKLICTIADNVVYNVSGDKDKLRQVVVNLIDNSMKYTKQGQIEAGMNTKDGKIVLSIKDTGVGIDPKVKNNLFEKFSRGDGAKLNASGSGLGLYLVKEIVKAHHGRVWVDSLGVGKGSTFSIELDEVK